MTSVTDYIDHDILDMLEKKFNLLDCIEFKEFDKEFDYLVAWLEKNRKISFESTDRLVVIHFDTDYYWHGHGINLNNFFNTWIEQDIPLHTMLFYTNHIGITAEIDQLCKYHNVNDRPTIIETILNPGNHRAEEYGPFELSVESITVPALCMMAGTPRSHRWAAYNHLKHLTTEQIAITLNAINKSTPRH